MLTFKKNFIIIFMVFLGFGIQTQVTILKSAEYSGLRINLIDFLLPFIGLVILISLISKRSKWPQFDINYIYLWLAGLGAVLALALANAYYIHDEILNWALFNKFVGWFILCAYFLMGAWLTANIKTLNIKILLGSLITTLIAVVSIQIIAQSIYFLSQFRIPFIYNDFPIEALMGNKNAFIFLFLTALCFSSYSHKDNKVFKALNYMMWFLLPLVFLYTGARSALIILPVLLAYLFFTKTAMPWKNIIFLTLLSITIGFVTQHFSHTTIKSLQLNSIEAIEKIDHVVAKDDLTEVENKMTHAGDKKRIFVLKHVLNMIQEKPLIGNGLGSVLLTQDHDKPHLKDIMDCTVLWLWAETGLLGLLVFLTFYGLCLKTLWTKATRHKDDLFLRGLYQASFLMLIIFAGMSLFHEILYTRFMWFFMGLSLAIPLHHVTSQSKETS